VTGIQFVFVGLHVGTVVTQVGVGVGSHVVDGTHGVGVTVGYQDGTVGVGCLLDGTVGGADTQVGSITKSSQLSISELHPGSMI
jgi:hypothetical protein